MTIKELTNYQKHRFNMNRLCCKCHQYIYDQDEFDFTVRTIGRRTFYNFMHKECEHIVKTQQEAEAIRGWWKR